MKFDVVINEKGNGPRTLEFDRPEVTIGRIKGNDIILPKGNISKRHSRIVVKGNAFVVVDLKSTNGTYVNGSKITSPHVLKNGDKIFIGDFTLTVAPQREADRTTSARTPLPRTPPPNTPPPQRPALHTLAPRTPASSTPAPSTPAPHTPLPHPPPRPATTSPTPRPASTAPPPRPPLPRPSPAAPPSLEADEELLAPIEDYGAGAGDHLDRAADFEVEAEPVDSRAARVAIQAAVFAELTRRDEFERLAGDPAAAEQAVRRALTNTLASGLQAAELDPDAVVKCVVTEIIGLGPLDRLLEDATVTRIFANNPHRIFVERGGVTVASEEIFSSAESMTHVIARLLRRSHLDLGQVPAVDARLADGCHLRALLPPLAAHGPVLVLCRPVRPTATLDLLVADGVLSAPMAEFLRTCVRLRKNIVVSTGGGIGGSDLLRALGSEMGARERIVTIEPFSQLGLPQSNVVCLETTSLAGAQGASLRELVRWALRLEPDRLIVDDCGGGAALEILQAMAGPLDGSALLVHGHSARECTGRIEAMMLVGAGDASARAVREVMARAIDIVVQIARFADGTPRVTEIAAVSGMEVDLITLQEIFAYRADGTGQDGRARGRFLATGAVPHFYAELQRRGEKPDLGLFREDT